MEKRMEKQSHREEAADSCVIYIGLKDDMDARTDVYVHSNSCKKCSDDNDGYYYFLDKAKKNVFGMEIVRDQSGSTLRVSQSRFYNEKLAQTLLEGHSILALEGSLSGDYNVKKNGMCKKLRSYDVVHDGFVTTEAAYMTLTKVAKEAIWLTGLAIESRFALKIVASIATGAL
nr:zinc finger, CCHC-type [Tanacetum cinerariifolium]